MHHLQLKESGRPAGNRCVMPTNSATQFWLKTKRRLTDVRGIMERRRFQVLRNRFYDTLWRDAATTVDAEAMSLPNGIMQIKRGSLATFVKQSDIMLDNAVASRLLLNKALTYQWLSAKGLRTPRSVEFDLDTIHLAEKFLLGQPGPVVVKPADGTGCGHGVTTQIATRTALHDAATHAAAFHPHLLVEEQLQGSSFRLLFLDGVFIDAVRRDPPTLTGNGKSSIRQLAREENDRRREGSELTALSPLIIDRECCNTLSMAGLTPASVLPEGECIGVKLAVNENAARENHVVRDEVHSEILDTCSRIARDFGIGFAGFDIMSNDISQPAEIGDTIFTEINTGPGIHHHRLVGEPEKAAPIASIILEHLFAARRGVFEL